MTPSVRADRAREHFERWDADGDGRVDRADWDTGARLILAALDEAPDSPNARALTDAYRGIWNFFADRAGIDRRDGALTPERFGPLFEEHVLGTDGARFEAVVRPAVEAMAALVDVHVHGGGGGGDAHGGDGDGRDRDGPGGEGPGGEGRVGPAELTAWLAAVDVRHVAPGYALRAIDATGDGRLSVGELAQAVRAYYLGETDVPLLGR
jgi:hypothetical protein